MDCDCGKKHSTTTVWPVEFTSSDFKKLSSFTEKTKVTQYPKNSVKKVIPESESIIKKEGRKFETASPVKELPLIVKTEKIVIGEAAFRVISEVSPLASTLFNVSNTPYFELRRSNNIIVLQWSNINGKIGSRTNYLFINNRITPLPSMIMKFPLLIDIEGKTKISTVEINPNESPSIKFYLDLDKRVYLDKGIDIQIFSSSITWIIE